MAKDKKPKDKVDTKADAKADKDGSYVPPQGEGAAPPLNEEQIRAEMEKKLPPEVQEKLKKIKEKLEVFQKRVIEKFDKYIMGIALLPPPKPGQPDPFAPPPQPGQPAQQKTPNPDEIHVLVLVDDSDSQKMGKEELRTKLGSIIDSMAQEIDKNLLPQTIILSELWQSCYDAKYDLLQILALGAPIFDTGMLAAVKIAEIHKTMVLKKFEKYIVSYVLAGSLVQGRATKTSDIDVWIVIDDTDVKKMTRAELKDKLRAIIIGMGIEAGDITGIRNKLNIQVYILTDFWDSLREANPIIFTLLRDGVPFYDRGIFMPWKQLLKMGKIKPSSEAIDMFMQSGEQMLKRVEYKLREIGMEDIYYAILTPSQAALMLYGVPPPAPRETAQLMRDIFVKKEKLLESKHVDTLEQSINLRKDIEHGTKLDVTGKEIDDLLHASKEFLKRVKTLFTEIENLREKEGMVHIYESAVTIIRDILRLEGIERVKNEEILQLFESEMVHQGKIPEKYLRMLHHIIKAKKDYDTGKLSKHEVESVKKESGEFIKFVIEYLQRKRGRELERTKVRIKHGEKYGEVILLDTVAYIIHDIDHEERDTSKAEIRPDGSLGPTEKCSLEELEKALAKVEIPPKVFIKEKTFESLKNVFGRDVEILMNY